MRAGARYVDKGKRVRCVIDRSFPRFFDDARPDRETLRARLQQLRLVADASAAIDAIEAKDNPDTADNRRAETHG